MDIPEKERDPNMAIAAEGLKSMYDENLKAGFNENQALAIVLATVTESVRFQLMSRGKK